MADPTTTREKLTALRTTLMQDRQTFIPHWTMLGQYILPRRPRFTVSDVNKGDRRSTYIIDSTGCFAANSLSGGMMGGLTSPARPWFRLAVPDQALSEIPAVKEWLEIVTRRMIMVFLKCNIYAILPITYKEVGVFGTSAVYLEEDFQNVLRARSIPIGSYVISANEHGIIDTCIRDFRMTVRQIVEKFGRREDGEIDWENISSHVKDRWNNNHKEDWIDVSHAIIPNPDHDDELSDARFKAYASIYWETGGINRPGQGHNAANYMLGEDAKKLLRVSGYDLFPVLVPRWEITGEDVWGTDCPGMTALGDIRQLQTVEKRGLQALEKLVNPTLVGPSHLRTRKVTLLPGEVNYSDESSGQKGLRPLHEVRTPLADVEDKQEQVRARIRRAFFEDLFLMMTMSDRREITATEVEERHSEKILMLGNVLERLNQDLLDPLIDITFEYMRRQGLIPDPPEELARQTLKVEYISIMALAQKQAGIRNLEKFTAFAVQLAEASGGSTHDKVDYDQIIDEYAEAMGVPAKVVVSDEAVMDLRRQRAQQQQLEREVALAAEGADAAKKLSQAEMGKDTALDRITNAAQQAAVA
jgi:hypothetical protein